MTVPATETAIWLALRARVASLTLTPALPVQWPNEAFTPPASQGVPQPYLEVRLLANEPASPFLANDSPNHHRGILQIGVCHRLDLASPQGETAPREVAGQVAAHFPRGLTLHHNGVRVKVPRVPRVGTAFKDEARQRWVVPVSIPYEAFA